MATTKKVTPETKPESVKVTDVKVEAKPAAEVKTAAKATVKAAAKPVAKVEEAAAPAKKETAKKAPAKKPAAKKAPAKKAPAKKTEVKANVYVQYGEKSYSAEELVQIAKDVWRYDLKMKAADFKTVELYVKPEESTVYYVINGDINGSFSI